MILIQDCQFRGGEESKYIHYRTYVYALTGMKIESITIKNTENLYAYFSQVPSELSVVAVVGKVLKESAQRASIRANLCLTSHLRAECI